MPLLVHRSPLFFCRVIVISVLKVNVQLIGRGPIVLEKHFHDNHSLGLTVNAEDNSAICTHWFCMRERERERALQVGKGEIAALSASKENTSRNILDDQPSS